MNMTDPIADLLTRIRNANHAKHDTVSIPSSNLKVEIAKILQAEGYINSYEVTGDTKKELTIELKYTASKDRVIQGIKKISKPGLRVYAKSDSVPRVLNGLGIAIISTSTGVVSDKTARSKKIGGEVLAYVW
ncbi:MAG: 30S ribosomal protein S8 [Erysipelotrichaceae bacterium]